jgi:hypothetical protein
MILLNLERGGWEGDPSFPLKACKMTPVKVRYSNSIIDEITPRTTYHKYYKFLSKAVSI